jgi:hypothetical protein
VPHERVIVTGRVSGRAPVAGAVTAGPGGTFALTLPLRPAACAEVFVRAQGSLGSTATMTLAAPACKPA